MPASARLVVEMLAKTGSFETDIKRAEGVARRLSRQSKATSGDVGGLSSALQRAANAATFVDGPLGGVASRITAVSAAAKSGNLAVLALGTGIGALSLGLTAAIRESEKFERLSLRTEAVIKATGQSAGLTADEIRDFSEGLAASTLASVEGVERAAQKLLTFRSVAGDTFTEALKLSQDLAALGFGTLESSATQLGKALEDPIQGLSSLRRVGVSFSAQQREVIENFVETNRIADAQAIILEALRQQVGGAGAAEAGGLAGAFDTLSQNVQKFLTNIGDSGPIDVANAAIARLAGTVAALNQALFPSGQDEFNDLIGRRLELQAALAQNPETSAARPAIAAELENVENRLRSLQQARETEQRAQNAARIASEQAAAQRTAEAEAAKEQEAAEKAAAETRRASTRAARTQASAAQALARQRESLISSLERERALLGASKSDIIAYDLAALNASESEIALAQSIREEIDALEVRNKLLEQGQSVTESLRTPQEQRDARVNDLGELRNVGAIDETTFTRGLEAANDALADFQQQQADALQSARDALYEGLLTEEEQIIQSYERRKQAILEATEVTELERLDLLSRLNEKALAEQEARDAEARSVIFKGGEQLFDGLAGLAKSFAGEQSTTYRALFAVSKAFAIADATLQLGDAMVKALNSGSFPANLASVAAVAAAGANLIGQITSVTFGGARADGGPVIPGRSFLVGERGPEMFVPNTAGMILPNEALQPQAAPEVRIRNINAFDPAVVDDYLGSDPGERTVMNIIQRNADAVRGFVSA